MPRDSDVYDAQFNMIGSFDGEFIIDLNGRTLPYRVDGDEIYTHDNKAARYIGIFEDGEGRLLDGTFLFKVG